MKRIGVFTIAALLTACASVPEPEIESKAVVQEVAYTPLEAAPVETGEYLFIPGNFRQLICRSSSAARSVENVGLASRLLMETGQISQAEHTHRFSSAVYMLVVGLRESGECRERTGAEPE